MKVDRVTANHSLSSTAIQQKFQHSLSLLFLVPGCNRQAKEGQIAAWRSGTKKQERKGMNRLLEVQEKKFDSLPKSVKPHFLY